MQTLQTIKTALHCIGLRYCMVIFFRGVGTVRTMHNLRSIGTLDYIGLRRQMIRFCMVCRVCMVSGNVSPKSIDSGAQVVFVPGGTMTQALQPEGTKRIPHLGRHHLVAGFFIRTFGLSKTERPGFGLLKRRNEIAWGENRARQFLQCLEQRYRLRYMPILGFDVRLGLPELPRDIKQPALGLGPGDARVEQKRAPNFPLALRDLRPITVIGLCVVPLPQSFLALNGVGFELRLATLLQKYGGRTAMLRLDREGKIRFQIAFNRFAKTGAPQEPPPGRMSTKQIKQFMREFAAEQNRRWLAFGEWWTLAGGACAIKRRQSTEKWKRWHAKKEKERYWKAKRRQQ
jgi:hypothetical protein